MSDGPDLAVDPMASTEAPAMDDPVDAHARTQDALEVPKKPTMRAGSDVTDGALAMGLTRTEHGAARQRSGERDSLVGESLAHFRIERLLGKGGMGEVYLATDTSLDRPVAIKRLPGGVADHPDLRARFFREARAQARLRHAHVCHIYFVGEERGQLFFAMEYVDGESLQARLDRDGPLAVAEALEICRMTALGLREAHAHGFTHRDIKPSNLMVDQHGQVKIVDFGLVKHSHAAALAEAVEPAGAAPASSEVAHTAMVGTPLYMAPEQADGQAVDFRADIYALGATLHQLVSGAPPFSGDSVKELVSRHQSDKRPAVRSTEKTASLIDGLCDRMMAKRPEDRFASYDELIAAIDRVSPTRTRPAGLWVRSFALVTDIICVALLILPVLLLPFVGEAIYPLTAAFYWILCHGRAGQTVGQWLFELEVVPTNRSGRLGYGQAGLRFAAQWGPFLLVSWVEDLITFTYGFGMGGRIAIRALMALSLLYMLFAALVIGLRSPERRTLWDRVAKTQVRYRSTSRS